MPGSSFWDSETDPEAPPPLSLSPAPSSAAAPGPISRSNSPSHISKGSGAAAAGWARPPPTGARRFLGKHLRKLSTSLPRYTPAAGKRGGAGFYSFRNAILRRPKLSGFLTFIVVAILYVVMRLHHNPVSNRLRAASGGSKFVIILAANQGGGVMTLKGAKEWAVERDSIANKRAYAERWGYHLEIKDMSTKKRYAHEWRESWEKVDVIKQTMRQHPKAEW